MPPSERCASGAIASMVSPCFPWRKLLSLTERLPPAERLALVERPSCRAAHRPERALERGLSLQATACAGLGEQSKAVSEALRAFAKGIGRERRRSSEGRAGRRSGRAGRAPPGGWAARAGYSQNPIAYFGGFGRIAPLQGPPREGPESAPKPSLHCEREIGFTARSGRPCRASRPPSPESAACRI